MVARGIGHRTQPGANVTLRIFTPALLIVLLLACDRHSDGGEPCSTDEGSGTAEAAETEASGDGEPTADAPGELVVYSGRSESMVAPLIEAFEAETGIDVRVNYAGSTQLAATLLEEGAQSPADVFFAQEASTMGMIAAEAMLTTLDSEMIAAVPANFRDGESRWVGVSGRARAITFNSEKVTADQLPASLDGFTAPEWRGRVGWAPENASFQSALAAMVALDGEEAATAWVAGMIANEARPFPSNTPGVTAVAAGEIDAMITNHYYLYRIKAEQGPDTPIENHFLRNGRSGSLVNITAAGVLTTAENADNANRFVAYLLSPEGQAHFAEENAEFPVVPGVETPQGLPSIVELAAPAIEFSQLANLETAVRILQTSGAL